MAEAIGVAGSIVGLAAFGFKLAVTLQTYVETSLEARDQLREIAFDVTSTASILLQLEEFLSKDHDAPTPVLQERGRQAIERLGAQCKKIFEGIFILLKKAADKPGVEKGTREASAEETVLNDPLLEFNKLHIGIFRSLAWPWLEPRIRRCQQWLERVKSDLFLHLTLISLAQFQLQHPTRAPGIFEQEQNLRDLAKLAKRNAAKRPPDRSARHQTDGSNASERPSSSAKSLKSVRSTESKGEEPPQTNPDVEIDVDRNSTNGGNHEGEQSVEPKQDDNNSNKERTTPACEISGFDAPVNPKLVLDSTIPPPLTLGAANIDRTEGEVQDNGRDAVNTAIDGASVSRSHVSFHGLIPGRIRQLLSRETRRDWENGEIEAYLLELPVRYGSPSDPNLTRLDMDDQQVRAALANIAPRYRLRRRPRLLDQYRSLGPRVRHEVDHAITYAKQWSCQSRTWIAIDVVEPAAHRRVSRGLSQPFASQLDMSIVLFFRLGEEVEPVRLEIADNGEAVIPYEHCRTWEMTRRVLARTVDSNCEDSVQEGRYDISNESGARIPPNAWRSSVRPGMTLKLLWHPGWGPRPLPISMARPPMPSQKAPPPMPSQKPRPLMPPPPMPSHGMPAVISVDPPRLSNSTSRNSQKVRPPPGWGSGFPPAARAPMPNFCSVSPKRSGGRKTALGPWGRSKRPSLSNSTSTSTDWSSAVGVDDSEIDQEMEELLGVEEDSIRESDMANAGLGELLSMWTNATDTLVDDDSGTDSSDASITFSRVIED